MNRNCRLLSTILCVGLLAGAAALAPPARAAAQATPPATPPPTAPSPGPAGASAGPGNGAVGAPVQGAGPEAGAGASAATAAPPGDFQTLDQEVQSVKKQVIDLNRDLFVLEENLLFPANTQVAVYLSMDVGAFFALDSVTLKIDNKEVANYLYTSREVKALLKGGVQRLYLGNQKIGKHELVAFFVGKGPHGIDYRRGAAITFDKGIGAKYLELKITDRVPKHQPEFLIKDWE